VAVYGTEAMVLRTTEFGEADLIVQLLTPERGRVAAMAKHARRSVKRFPGSLDLFNHVRVQLQPRRRAGMPLLERAVLLSPFLSLRADPRRYALGCYLTELLVRLSPEEGVGPEMVSVFDFALQSLRVIEACTPDVRVRVLLELRALDALGLRPELSSCVRCGRSVTGPGAVAFHVADGGVLCDACTGGQELLLRVHLGTLRALEQGLRLPIAEIHRLNLPPRALAEAVQLVGRFQRYHVGVELRSERFLAETLPAVPT
jgi:DNA repair protein RecO (recombination protein O)